MRLFLFASLRLSAHHGQLVQAWSLCCVRRGCGCVYECQQRSRCRDFPTGIRLFRVGMMCSSRRDHETLMRRHLQSMASTTSAMFARTALRAASRSTRCTQISRLRATASYATQAATPTPTTPTSNFSIKEVDSMNPRGVEISKAQQIADNGFISGTASRVCNTCRTLTDAASQRLVTRHSYG